MPVPDLTAVEALALSAGELLRATVPSLAPVSGSPRVDAELLLAATLGYSRGRLLARLDETVATGPRMRFAGLLERRRRGEPVAYLLESREFWSLPLRVTPAVLIPRPETELLVECALRAAERIGEPRLLDRGTGSGAIALALAHSRPDARVTAVERSAAALAVARENAARLGLERVRFLHGDWFAPLARGACFDLIVSNPPYVARGDPALEAAVAAHEPEEALYATEGGFADLAAIVAEGPMFLVSGGALLLEHGAGQDQAVLEMLRQRGFVRVEDCPDLAGRPRVAIGWKP